MKERGERGWEKYYFELKEIMALEVASVTTYIKPFQFFHLDKDNNNRQRRRRRRRRRVVEFTLLHSVAMEETREKQAERAFEYKNSNHKTHVDQRRKKATISIRKKKKREKLKQRRSCNTILSHDEILDILDNAKELLLSGDVGVSRRALHQVKIACSQAHEPNTSEEETRASEYHVIDMLIGNKTLIWLMCLLQNVHTPVDMQRDIVWILQNVAAGTTLQAQYLVLPELPNRQSCCQVLTTLLQNTSDNELCGTILACFANIAMDCVMLRDVLLNGGICDCLSGIERGQQLNLIKHETLYHLGVLLEYLYKSNERNPQWEQLQPTEQMVINLFLLTEHSDVLVRLLRVLGSISNQTSGYQQFANESGCDLDDIFTIRVRERLHAIVVGPPLASAPHARSALTVIGNLCSLPNPAYTEHFVKDGTITYLSSVLMTNGECDGPRTECRGEWLTEICYIAGNLAGGTEQQALMLFESALPCGVVRQLQSAVSRKLRREAAMSLSSIVTRARLCMQSGFLRSLEFLKSANVVLGACEQLVTKDVAICESLLEILNEMMLCLTLYTAETILSSNVATGALQELAEKEEQNEYLARRASSLLEAVSCAEREGENNDINMVIQGNCSAQWDLNTLRATQPPAPRNTFMTASSPMGVVQSHNFFDLGGCGSYAATTTTTTTTTTMSPSSF